MAAIIETTTRRPWTVVTVFQDGWTYVHQAACTCGWRGPQRLDGDWANDDRVEHSLDHRCDGGPFGGAAA